MADTNNISTHETISNITKDGKGFLYETVMTGFVFNINLLMEQMVANQHALQQILTASTARAVTDIYNIENPNKDNTLKNIEIVLKTIQDSSSSYINLIKELSVEAKNALKIIQQ